MKYKYDIKSPEGKTGRVVAHLFKHGSITSWEAIIKYKATRLSGIIFDLKKKFNIKSHYPQNDDGKQEHFVVYTLHPRNTDRNYIA